MSRDQIPGWPTSRIDADRLLFNLLPHWFHNFHLKILYQWQFFFSAMTCWIMADTSDQNCSSDKPLYPARDSLSTDEFSEIQDTEESNLVENYDEDPLNLDTLPVELLMYISNFLDAKFIVHTLSKVCWIFHDLFSRDIYWKTRISKRWPRTYPPIYSKFLTAQFIIW